MLFLLATEAPNCFSRQTFLQSDIQSRTMFLNLIPQKPMDPLCLALNGSFGTAQIFFLNPAGFPDFISTQFEFIAGKINIAAIRISSLTIAQVNALIKIQAAEYIVKISKSADIKGALETISYLKIDVSSCWSYQIFAYGPNTNDEQFEFRLTPNECVIPENAKLYPVFTFKENGTQVDMAEFQYGSQPGEYKSPYIHTEVTMARLQCKDILDEELKSQCYLFVEYVTNTQDYYFGIKLSYETNGIKTNVYQEADLYQALGSRVCAGESKLTTYFFPDGYTIYHDQFQNFPDCIIAPDCTYSVLTGSVQWQLLAYFYTKRYSVQQYSKSQYVHNKQDMTKMFERNFESYPQYIQYNELDEIVGSFYFSTTVVKQCIYLVNLMVVDDNLIDLEFRSHYFEVCQNISENFEFQLISSDLDILYKEQLSINMNVKSPIQKHRYKLKTNINLIFEKNLNAEFSVRGASFFYSGKDINYSKDILFIIIQLSYFAVYISISLITVFIYLKKQNTKE